MITAVIVVIVSRDCRVRRLMSSVKFYKMNDHIGSA